MAQPAALPQKQERANGVDGDGTEEGEDVWNITVYLASGRACTLALQPHERRYHALRDLASEAFGCRVSALAAPDGTRVPEGGSLDEMGLQDGVCLTAVVARLLIYSTNSHWSRVEGPGCRGSAFACVEGGRFVAAWGDTTCGGDTGEAQGALQRALVTQVCATSGAFAALTIEGDVITWGDQFAGGCCDDLQTELRGQVRQLFSLRYAFAAVTHRGKVIIWGSGIGCTALLEEDLQEGVKSVHSTGPAFAILKANGSVITWGDPERGGDSSEVRSELQRDVRHICCTTGAFAAIKSGGGVVAWGDPMLGGLAGQARQDSPELCAALQRGVRRVAACTVAFAAVKSDGAVLTWGDPVVVYSWDQTARWQLQLVQDILPFNGLNGLPALGQACQRLQPVHDVYATDYAFAAVTHEGQVVTWGEGRAGGDSLSVMTHLQSGVRHIYVARGGAFAAVKDQGKVVTWGRAEAGGNSTEVEAQLQYGVKQICATDCAFAAVKASGQVVTWGAERFGGDSAAVRAELKGEVLEVFASTGAFAAVKGDGSVITWGSAEHGGDSSPAQAELTELRRAARARAASEGPGQSQGQGA